MLQGLRNLWRRLRDPRPKSIEEWAEAHAEVVRKDLERVLPHLPEHGVVVDVGANIGLFAEAVLEARPGLQVLCFEPVRKYYELCRQRFDGDDRVRVFNLAMSNQSGTTVIYKTGHNYGGNSMVTELIFDERENARIFPETEVEEETIRCQTWTEFAAEQGIDVVDFIKTDTEGFDYAVLEGMLGFLGETPRLPPILSELLNEGFHTRWSEQAAVIQRLFEIGYAEQDLSSMNWIEDILFLPGESPTDG